MVIRRNGKDYTVDSSWVVPHPPALVLRFNSHINLEVCVSSSGVKYLTGYFHKGSDRQMVKTQVEGEQVNEVKEYVDHRVMCANMRQWPVSSALMFTRASHLSCHFEFTWRTSRWSCSPMVRRKRW